VILNFPIPYPDELIYSTVARAGVHMGITSPKQLLNEVFNNRHVIATVDLPNHLEHIAHWYTDELNYNVERLAYEHTLFPIYAPFTTESRRLQCLKWMATESLGAIHLTLGLTSSRLKKAKSLNYCPVCMQQQLATKGECFWKRQWQVSGANCCLQHGQLLETNLASHHNHRHQFFSANPDLCPSVDQLAVNSQARRVARQVNILLAMTPATSATFAQWSKFYSQLARQAGLKLGHKVQHDRIKERVLERWPVSWLNQYGLMMSDNQTCWLCTIFRKHRKSFSYLEHIVVMESFLPEQWRIDEVIAEVAAMQLSVNHTLTAPSQFKNVSASVRSVYRKHWLEMVKQYSAKLARKNGGGAIYAWLYRYDRDWLISTNRQFQRSFANNVERVNWHARDLSITRQLINIRKQYQLHLDAPRGSRNWYLSKLGQVSSIEKNLHKLLITRLFFKKYCENVTDYQIRRIILATSFLRSNGTTPHHWRILRKAGLSKERITDIAENYLNSMVLNECRT
jgi:hypothetical protein